MKTDNMTPQQYGDWVEDTVKAALEELQAAGPLFYTRLYDTRSASTFLPPQPGDFIGICKGTGFLLEVKASTKFESLAQPGAMRKLIDTKQALASYLACRAKGEGLFLFRGRESGAVEIWDGGVVREAYVTPRGALSGARGQGLKCRDTCDDNNLQETVKTLISEIFL